WNDEKGRRHETILRASWLGRHPAWSGGAPCEGEIRPQLLGVLAHDVGGLVTFDPPALRERADVHGVESELVVEPRDDGHCLVAVARRRERATILGARRSAIRRDVGGRDVVEAL